MIYKEARRALRSSTTIQKKKYCMSMNTKMRVCDGIQQENAGIKFHEMSRMMMRCMHSIR
jgi:hypothetical protein